MSAVYAMFGQLADIYGWGFWEWHAEKGFLSRRGHACTLADGAEPDAVIPVAIDLVFDRWRDQEFSNWEADFSDVWREISGVSDDARKAA